MNGSQTFDFKQLNFCFQAWPRPACRSVRSNLVETSSRFPDKSGNRNRNIRNVRWKVSGANGTNRAAEDFGHFFAKFVAHLKILLEIVWSTIIAHW